MSYVVKKVPGQPSTLKRIVILLNHNTCITAHTVADFAVYLTRYEGFDDDTEEYDEKEFLEEDNGGSGSNEGYYQAS